jgi:hypothetical protein
MSIQLLAWKGQNRKAQGRAEGRQASSGALAEFPSRKLRHPDKGGTTTAPINPRHSVRHKRPCIFSRKPETHLGTTAFGGARFGSRYIASLVQHATR